MTTDPVLLDTTIQLWRIAYGADERSRFAEELVDKTEIYTTSLVFREFLSLIRDVKTLHDLTADLISPDHEGQIQLALLPQFLAANGWYSARSLKRFHLVIGRLLEDLRHTRGNKKKILVAMRRISGRWKRDFFTYSSANGEERSLICLTALDESSDDLKKLLAQGPFPTKVFPSGAAAFLERKKSLVEQVESLMAQAARENRDDRLLDFLRRLKDESGRFDFANRLPKYKRDCWRLGDLLIALECPEGVALYSTDRAFLVLSRALDRTLYNGYRSPEPGAES